MTDARICHGPTDDVASTFEADMLPGLPLSDEGMSQLCLGIWRSGLTYRTAKPLPVRLRVLLALR